MADSHQIIVRSSGQLAGSWSGRVPALFRSAGSNATRRFIEFFTANIRNQNTREAYGRAAWRFATWCESHNLRLGQLSPVLVAAYIEQLGQAIEVPSVKQHLASLRMLFDFLVVGQVLPTNPAAGVRGPKHVVKRGKTAVMTPEQARQLLDSIDTATIGGLRDRAMIGVMLFSFSRVSALLGMNVADYYADGKRWWFRLHEKGGKFHEVPAHHKAEEYVDAYLVAAGIEGSDKSPLFRSVNRHRQLTDRRITRRETLAMIKRRARQARLPTRICNHSCRATGITAYLLNGGTLEHAQRIAAHESPRTTKLYDRTSDEITLDEIERILI
jgi:site-specific recombinase XerD